MEKAFLLFVLIVMGCYSVYGQAISPTAQSFEIGQPVKFKIVFSGVIGVENEIKNLSESVKVENFIEFNAGTTNIPGFYRFDFIKPDGKRSKFQVFVLPKGFSNYERTVLSTTSVSNDHSGLFNNFFALTESDRTIILKEALSEYFKKHTVSVGTTFVVCIASAPGGPATFAVACGKQMAGNAKDFLLIYVDQATKAMVNKELITNEERVKINNVANVSGLIFEIASSNLNISGGKIVIQKGTAIENLVTLSTFGTTVIENKTVETGSTISGEFIKKYEAIIKLR